MCGIAGILADGPLPEAALADLAHTLAGALAHRGPDGAGWHLDPARGAALVHTRLAIVDVAGGDQPFVDAAGRVLVANGEIYNHLDLRAFLEAEGAAPAWRSGSDCEPLLPLFAHLGEGFLGRLRGMVGLALLEPVADHRARVLLARDPFGIKPLYVAETTFEGRPATLFASEPRALLASRLIPRAADPGKLAELLQLQFTTGRPTALPGIERVLPGETVWLEGGRVHSRTRRHPLPPRPTSGPPTEPLQAIDRHLEDTVEAHRMADVPIGMFLSGGLDSATLLSLMARRPGPPVKAFTAAFPGSAAADERARARAVAQAAGAEHIDLEVTRGDFLTHLPAIAACLDDPAADYAIVPTWLLARRAAQEVKVVLTGEGGDELLAGYGRYRAATRPWPLARPMRRRGTFDGLGVLADPPTGWRDGIAAAERGAAELGLKGLKRAQWVDLADWLPHDLLAKLDRCLMAHGLEGRVPFLDPVFAPFAFHLPDGLKVKGRLGKWLLRQWLAEHAPAAAPMAPKQGFTVPVGEWIASQGKRLGPLVAAQPGIASLTRPAEVRRLFASLDRQSDGRARFAAWSLLFTALWHQHHVMDLPADGDVFETLTRRG
ncbi:asparagine synthase (glutamine-hydrolyzing) [Roseospirillum parvum]|uniref:asparagine synthase (glutamine-hydrolyzing) n=1 Tax=Roseospirillum parvum TaxID=83401 RepID=A0A1G7U1S1_9PROT|nr:asparagine synthase (glutamine-hydrolyzing) [Roseospirillum parvum]SDG41476.1 asparagine synthase (glutamine-hydrolysing) [Roseospirillum parvum]